MMTVRVVAHSVRYGVWLLWQVLVATWSIIVDANKLRSAIDPIIVAYPLRVQTDREVGLFTTSITMTPGTLSLGLLEVGDALPQDVSDYPGPHEPMPAEDAPDGRVLLVHAAFGSDPEALMGELADMEQRLAPVVCERTVPRQPDGYVAKLFYSDGAPNGGPGPEAFAQPGGPSIPPGHAGGVDGELSGGAGDDGGHGEGGK
ncbi:Na+/H+ antiporter subunit E [Corynebacterium kroppenstedtii]|uniref:Na+/H+ antiporter subunit E n=1 Tax=Corynebacterium sp. PCR 32 TaxID=3351342 RepID=UPI00309C9090